MSTSTTPEAALDVPFPIAIDEALGEKLQPNEAADVTKMADVISGTIHKQYSQGDAKRDVHAKATGVLKAQFTVNHDLPPQFAKGVFVPGKTYEAYIRLSNASGNAHQNDDSQDGRGFAIKLLGVPGPKLLESDKDATTQDFVLINRPFFFVSNTHTYLTFFESLDSSSPLQKLSGFLKLGLKSALLAVWQASGKIANPLQQQYYSAVPYQLGMGEDRQAVKYSVKPVSPAHDPLPARPTPDYLHEAVKTTLSNGEVQFKFMVQPKVGEYMDVEDSRVEGKESESPFEEVATITIPKQDVDAAETVALGERMSFNSWHSLAEHRPLGSLNRARKVVYERISRVRDEINHVPREEPSSLSG
ncbi:hypothetical protein BGZ98_003737 [Dissophora globulifera]|nr:hypothetical protein BGZ98_003737 [Dissophora globulifera]